MLVRLTTEGLRACVAIKQGTMQGWSPPCGSFRRGMQRTANRWEFLENGTEWACKAIACTEVSGGDDETSATVPDSSNSVHDALDPFPVETRWAHQAATRTWCYSDQLVSAIFFLAPPSPTPSEGDPPIRFLLSPPPHIHLSPSHPRSAPLSQQDKYVPIRNLQKYWS